MTAAKPRKEDMAASEEAYLRLVALTLVLTFIAGFVVGHVF